MSFVNIPLTIETAYFSFNGKPKATVFLFCLNGLAQNAVAFGLPLNEPLPAVASYTRRKIFRLYIPQTMR